MSEKKAPVMQMFFGPGKQESDEERKKRLEEENLLIKGKSLDPDCGEKKHRLILESMTSGVEKYYFWYLRFLRESPKLGFGLGFEKVEKIKDLFDASVTSSFHGHVGAKLSAMQQQAQQFLATIGQMVKTLFPLIRQIRMTDERLTYYVDSAKGNENAEIALKSVWVNVVEQGMQNPSSVYSLASKIGFLALPELFFSINPKNGKEGVDAAIKHVAENVVKNKKNLNVLRDKLFSYYTWKENTNKELNVRYQYYIKYLKQHYSIIKLYMNWVRPYLSTVQKLQMKGALTDADLVSAFETSKIQLELMAYNAKDYKKYRPVILVKFEHVTRPELIYTPQGQRQPVHMGRTEIIIEPYVATQEQIEAYKAKQDQEDIELLGHINTSMEALREDLQKYLKDADKLLSKEEEKKDMKRTSGGIFEPFGALISGFRDVVPKKGEKEKKPMGRIDDGVEYNKAKKTAQTLSYVLYDVFKKAHGYYNPV